MMMTFDQLTLKDAAHPTGISRFGLQDKTKAGILFLAGIVANGNTVDIVFHYKLLMITLRQISDQIEIIKAVLEQRNLPLIDDTRHTDTHHLHLRKTDQDRIQNIVNIGHRNLIFDISLS